MVSYVTDGDLDWPYADLGFVRRKERARSDHVDPLIVSDGTAPGLVVNAASPDDLSREVYCILGIPVDAIEMPAVLRGIKTAAVSRAPFLISTPNLNFLVNSQSDSVFRESLLLSDLCPADGMSIVWIARLIGVPIKHRIAGSDFFDKLGANYDSAKPLKIFLFGGAEGVAVTAARALNARSVGLSCVGVFCPGFGSIEEMSRQETVDCINSSNADFLAVSLGAKKGQSWLLRNHHRLLIPIRVHLGASINFQAGTLKRAPYVMREFGLEWLWRIKEEPYLWRRYWNDGRVLLRLLLTHVLPLAIWTWWLRLKRKHHGQDLIITQALSHESLTVSLSGSATYQHIDRIIAAFEDAIAIKKPIVIDFSNTHVVDARFLGLLLMLRKRVKGIGATLVFLGMSPGLKRVFRFSGLGFLLFPPSIAGNRDLANASSID
jgi:N-acetylglucosaminyldiphosphoundecaprenol N-acetyl-beta-D-mannosaminyltransferase